MPLHAPPTHPVAAATTLEHCRNPSLALQQPAFAFDLPVLSPLFATAFAATLEAITRLKERRTPPGQLIALRNDGRRTHVIYHAPPNLRDEPCVVLEAGANSWSPMWDLVSQRVERVARVLRYDRPGFGFSEPPQRASPHRSIFSVAEHLHATLLASGAGPPYVLVAHSLGALYINVLLTHLRPGDVLGVVYVDAASPKTVRLLEGVVPRASPPAWLASALGRLGLLRLLAPLVLRQYGDSFRGDLKREAITTWARGHWLLSYTAEWVGALSSIRARSNDSAEDLHFPPGWLGEIPIIVLVPDVYQRTEGKAYISGLQKEVADYSNDAKLVTVSDCGHFIQLDRPDVVADAIESIIRRSKEKDHWRKTFWRNGMLQFHSES